MTANAGNAVVDDDAGIDRKGNLGTTCVPCAATEEESERLIHFLTSKSLSENLEKSTMPPSHGLMLSELSLLSERPQFMRCSRRFLENREATASKRCRQKKKAKKKKKRLAGEDEGRDCPGEPTMLSPQVTQQQ